MTGQSYQASLRLLSTGRANDSYRLPQNQEVVIGREPSCQIALDSNTYKGVSRRHALVRQPAFGQWEICDLNSANGIYINGQRLSGCQSLRPGDRISLGQNSAQFVFESQSFEHQTPAAPMVHGFVNQSLEADRVLNQPFHPRNLPQIDSNWVRKAISVIVPGVVAYVLAKLLGLLLPLAIAIAVWRGNLFFSNTRNQKTALQISGGTFAVELALFFFLGWRWSELWWISLIGLIIVVVALPNENGRILIGASLSPSPNVQR